MVPEKGQLEKKTKFIKDRIDQMDEDQLTRFEFFIRQVEHVEDSCDLPRLQYETSRMFSVGHIYHDTK